MQPERTEAETPPYRQPPPPGAGEHGKKINHLTSKLTMTFKSAICMLSAVVVATASSGVLEPYLPIPAAPPPAATAIRKEEVRFPLPDGTTAALPLYRKSLDGIWKFSGLECSAIPFPSGEKAQWGQPDYDDSRWSEVTVPKNFYTYPDQAGKSYYSTMSKTKPYYRGCYRRTIILTPEELSVGRVLLRFNAIGYEAILHVNGRKAGRHHGDFTPFEADVTAFVKPGENLIALEVLSDFGDKVGNIDRISHVYGSQFSQYAIRGGLWQSVELRLEADPRVSRLLVNPRLSQKTVELDYTIVNHQSDSVRVTLDAIVTDAMKTRPNQVEGRADRRELLLKPGENNGTITVRLTDPTTWSPERPQLYYATIVLLRDGKLHTARTERLGYREFTAVNGEFRLNGKKIYLFGESLIVSNDLSDEYIIEKLTRMRQYNINCVRTAHQPATPRFYELADEIGMMINNEWGWSFSERINGEVFEKNNQEEIRKWVERDYNHPSVVMWSGGNEVTHRPPEIGAQLDKQVQLIRTLDRTHRPVGSFSGSASLAAYGRDRRETDFLDLHEYTGTTRNGAWTLWPEMAAFRRKQLAEVYGKDYLQRTPVIFWENIGLGWGWKSDPDFKLSDIRAYNRYATETVTEWATPNGIGFAGSVGLARALSPDGKSYAQNIYGKRLGEMFRSDPQFRGVATGWFHNLQPGMMLWNQPTLVMLRNSAGLPPRNLWSGRAVALRLPIANHSGIPIPAGTLAITLVSPGEATEQTILEMQIPPVTDFGVQEFPVEFTLPETVEGRVQLRLTYRAGTRELSRNFYDIFVQPPSLMQTQLSSSLKIAVLDVGSRKDSDAFAARLRTLGLGCSIIDGRSSLDGYQLAIIPPAAANDRKLSFDRQRLFNWIDAGGSLLALEQQAVNGGILEAFRVIPPGRHYLLNVPNAHLFVDLIYPEHPVFEGLDQSCFDTWENPDRGSVIEYQIAPFSLNAIAAKPPLLGELSTQTAILEATYGKGRIFWSQLAADKLWGRDSAATRYLVNLLRYMTGSGRFEKVSPLDLKSAENGYEIGANVKFIAIDLKKAANRDFRDETAGDGKGGWTDQGANDFRNLPVGEQRAAGIPFQIIDPATNGGRGCIALKGEYNPGFAEAVTGIEVNAGCSRLFFLHTAGYLSGSTIAGRYVIHYRDGETEHFDMLSGKNIGDWWGCGFLPDARLGIIVSNPVKEQVGCYVAQWINPHPEKEIATIDILSSENARRQNINWLPEPSPTTFVIAITGEVYNGFHLDIDTSDAPGEWNPGGNAQKDQPPAKTTVQGEKTGPGGGRVIALDFPAGTEQSIPVTLVRFKQPAQFDPGQAAYLTAWVRSESPGAITLILPSTGWKNNYRVTLETDGSGQWRQVRLPLPESQRRQVSGQTMLGELWFQNNPAWLGKKSVPPLKLEIADIALE